MEEACQQWAINNLKVDNLNGFHKFRCLLDGIVPQEEGGPLCDTAADCGRGPCCSGRCKPSCRKIIPEIHTDKFVQICGNNSCVCKGFPNPNVREALLKNPVNLEDCAKACQKRKLCFGFEYWRAIGDHKEYANCFQCPVDPNKMSTISAVSLSERTHGGAHWANVYAKKSNLLDSQKPPRRACRQEGASCSRKRKKCCPHLRCSRGKCKRKKVCFEGQPGKRCPKGWYCSSIVGSCRKCKGKFMMKTPRACKSSLNREPDQCNS